MEINEIMRIAHDIRFLKRALPNLGEYFKSFFSGKPNDVFKEDMLSPFIKEGKIGEGKWLLRKQVTSYSGTMKETLNVTLNFEIERKFHDNL